MQWTLINVTKNTTLYRWCHAWSTQSHSYMQENSSVRCTSILPFRVTTEAACELLGCLLLISESSVVLFSLPQGVWSLITWRSLLLTPWPVTFLKSHRSWSSSLRTYPFHWEQSLSSALTWALTWWISFFFFLSQEEIRVFLGTLKKGQVEGKCLNTVFTSVLI